MALTSIVYFLLAIGVAFAAFDFKTFKSQVMTAHNAARQEAKPGMQPLSWSSTLASFAQEWANGCQFKHHSQDVLSAKKYGENIYISWGHSADTIGKDTVNKWVAEKADYHYGSNSCTPNKMCGHYTAVVWEATTKVGCGYKHCSSDNSQLVVCSYKKPGNMRMNGVKQKPY